MSHNDVIKMAMYCTKGFNSSLKLSNSYHPKINFISLKVGNNAIIDDSHYESYGGRGVEMNVDSHWSNIDVLNWLFFNVSRFTENQTPAHQTE
jgi:hypothetical protein